MIAKCRYCNAAALDEEPGDLTLELRSEGHVFTLRPIDIALELIIAALSEFRPLQCQFAHRASNKIALHLLPP